MLVKLFHWSRVCDFNNCFQWMQLFLHYRNSDRGTLVSYRHELPKEFKRIQSMNICNISPNAQESKAGPRQRKPTAYPLSFSYLSLHEKSKMKLTETVNQRCFLKKVLVKISQKSHQNTCARVSLLTKLQALACNFIKKQTRTGVFQ